MLTRTLRHWLQGPCVRPSPLTFGDINTARTVILVYNTMWGHLPGLSEGEIPEGCAITTDRRYWSRAQAVVFHLPTLHRLPLCKPAGQLWVAWSKECPENYPQQKAEGYRRRFDLRMTYEQDAEIISPYYGELAARRFRSGPRDKSELICSFVSSDVNRSERTEFLRELMKYLPVHCYGKLFRNRTVERDRGAETRKEIYSRYKFVLAMENALAPDYVTEKFYEPFEAGSVPVYRGAPNVARLAPADDCFINASDYDSPQSLAKFLLQLADDPQRYEKMMAWRQRPFLPSFETLLNRSQESIWLRLCRRIDGRNEGPATDCSQAAPVGNQWWVRESWRKVAAQLAWRQLPLALSGHPRCWPYDWQPPPITHGEVEGFDSRAQPLPLWSFLESARRWRGSLAQGAFWESFQSALSPVRRAVLASGDADQLQWVCAGPGWFRALLLPECSRSDLRCGAPVLVGISARTRPEVLTGILERGQRWWAWLVDEAPDPEVTRMLQFAEQIFASSKQLSEALGPNTEPPPLLLPPAVQPRLYHPGRATGFIGLPDPWLDLANSASQVSVEEPWEERKRKASRSHQVRRHHSIGARLRQVGLLPDAPPAVVSVLCCTRRPVHLELLFENFARQSYSPKELVLVLHGEGFPSEKEILGRLETLGFSSKLLRAPQEWSLGRCLQAGSDLASGSYIARFDDDDYYGPGYLEHMVAYLEDSQAGMVGKNSFPILFSQSQRSLLYKPGRENQFTLLESGATMLYRRQILHLGPSWPDRSMAEDIGLASSCWIRAIPQLAVDPFDYVCRRGSVDQHAWKIGEDQLRKNYPEFSHRLKPGDTDY